MPHFFLPLSRHLIVSQKVLHLFLSSAEQFSPVMRGIECSVELKRKSRQLETKQRLKDWHLEVVEKQREKSAKTALQGSLDKAPQATAAPPIPRIPARVLCGRRGLNPSTGDRFHLIAAIAVRGEAGAAAPRFAAPSLGISRGKRHPQNVFKRNLNKFKMY